MMPATMLDPELAFTVVNTLAAAGWLLLVCFPRWQWTERLVISGFVALVLAAVYCVLLSWTLLGEPQEGAGFGSLAAVARLFASPWGLLAGWIHYLCFDLVVGTEIQRRLAHRPLARIPCLVLTFLAGPIGWTVSWFVVRQEHLRG